MKRILTPIGIILILTSLAFGQSAESLPSFEAADVHVSAKSSNPQTGGGFLRGGRFRFRNATMVDLISSAYGIEPEKVIGGPSWLEYDRFDIVAKAPASATNDTAKLMLRSLLADRFKLVIRDEDQPMNVYALTLKDGKHQMKPSSGGASGCQGIPQNPQPGEIPYNVVACHNMTTTAFAAILRSMAASSYLEYPVADLTGLQGNWDFELKWTPQERLGFASNPISLFDALEKQLGLKLTLQKHSMRAIVVERVNEKPTDNSPGLEKILPVVTMEFEVADVKPSMPGTTNPSGNLRPGGRLDLHGIPMKGLLMLAWDINNDDMLVGPKWMDSERFDVVAKAPGDVTVSDNAVDVDTLRAMLKNLLIDRFKIKFHNEDRPASVYALSSSKRELKMKKGDPSVRASCMRSTATNPVSNLPIAMMTCKNTTMTQLVERLPVMAPMYIDHPAINLTGIEGGWDFVLSWTPKGAFQLAGARGQGANAAPNQALAQGPQVSDPTGGTTIFENVEKQLGLKLEMQKHPMPVLVIDQIEQKPTEN